MRRLKHALSSRGIRHLRIRRKVHGTSDKPRMTVHRSLHHLEVQLIDDLAGMTLASASTRESIFKKSAKGNNCKAATLLGGAIAKRAKEKGISQVVFDRSGYLYHGRIKALAQAARESGLEF